MKRREFLKTSLAASTLAGLSSTALGADSVSSRGREYYELRIYRLKDAAGRQPLLDYLENAAIPAWNRLGIKPVGVFAQQERTEPPTKTEVRDAAAVVVLLPYPTLRAFAAATRAFSDPGFGETAGDYWLRSKENPVFDRIDSWFMLAFAGMPKLELPAYSREKRPRMFELRTYQSYSEAKALRKVQMFNSGEIQTMREVGLAPVFYGQTLIGKDLPHLTYMLSAEDEAAHKAHWSAFGQHPVWKKLNSDSQYADTVSNIQNQFLSPLPCSQI
jgi:NIPSNAP